MMRLHQTLVRSHGKAQKRPELIGSDLAHQLTMAILLNSEKEITACIMLRIVHQNHQIMVTPGEDFGHPHRIIGEDILGAHQ